MLMPMHYWSDLHCTSVGRCAMPSPKASLEFQTISSLDWRKFSHQTRTALSLQLLSKQAVREHPWVSLQILFTGDCNPGCGPLKEILEATLPSRRCSMPMLSTPFIFVPSLTIFELL